MNALEEEEPEEEPRNGCKQTKRNETMDLIDWCQHRIISEAVVFCRPHNKHPFKTPDQLIHTQKTLTDCKRQQKNVGDAGKTQQKSGHKSGCSPRTFRSWGLQSQNQPKLDGQSAKLVKAQ